MSGLETALFIIAILAVGGIVISYGLRQFGRTLADIQEKRGCNEEGELRISPR